LILDSKVLRVKKVFDFIGGLFVLPS